MIKILMTNPYQVNFEINTINTLFEKGLDRLIVSKPEFDTNALEKYILKIDAQFHKRLILIEEFGLIEKYNTAGVLMSKDHLKQLIFNNFYFSPFYKRNPTIEVYQKIKTLKELDRIDKRVTRALIYPTFVENYKQNVITSFDNSSLQSRKNKDILLFAMGGVNASRLPEIQSHNFDGYVIHSTIWRNSIPLERFQEFLDFEALTNAKKIV